MEVTFLPAELPRWDQVRGEALAVFIFSDVRPLRGPAGLLDWRLGAKLSGWIEAGRLAGADKEVTLFPVTRPMAWRSVLAVGLGRLADFSEARFREGIRRVVATLRGLGLRRLAIALPGRETGRIAPRRAMELVMEELGSAGLTELTVIDTPAAHKEMAEALRGESPSPSMRTPIGGRR